MHISTNMQHSKDVFKFSNYTYIQLKHSVATHVYEKFAHGLKNRKLRALQSQDSIVAVLLARIRKKTAVTPLKIASILSNY